MPHNLCQFLIPEFNQKHDVIDHVTKREFWINKKPFRFQRNCINHYIEITSIFHLCSSKISIDFRRKTRTSRFEETFTISCYFICQSWKRPGRLFVIAWEGKSLLPSHATSGSSKSNDTITYRSGIHGPPEILKFFLVPVRSKIFYFFCPGPFRSEICKILLVLVRFGPDF